MTSAIVERLFRGHAVATTIHQGGAQIAALKALIGSTDLTAETEDGVVSVGKSVDFLYLRETFVATTGGAQIVVDVGTEIRRRIGNEIHIHQALPRDRAPNVQPVDPHLEIVRVHTQFVRTEPAT